MAEKGLYDLTPEERAELERGSAKWRRRFAEEVAAIRESERITAEDLAIRITPCYDDDL